MVKITFAPKFKSQVKSINDSMFKNKIKKQIIKIIENPESGKPLRYSFKGERSIYIKPYRLFYAYIKDNDEIIFLRIMHRDQAYN